MSQEKYTLLLTSNKSLATKALTVPRSWLVLGLGLGVLVTGIFGFVVFDYVQLLIKETQYKFIKARNEQLSARVQLYTEKMDKIQVDLEKIERFSKKLKMITNVENDADKELELTIGKPLIENEEKDRQPAANGKLSAVIDKTAKENTEESRRAFGFPLLKKSNSEYAFMSSQKDAELLLSFEKAKVDAVKVERDMTLLWDKISAQKDLLSATPSIRPANGWLSSGFGYRSDPFTKRATMHKGVDFAASIGTAVYAPADGIVSYAGREGGYGKIVSIDHGYGIVTRFAHNSKLVVKTGQKIRRWDKIAEVGSTGRSSGPHLHYEVRLNGVPVDPENYILVQ